MFKDQDKFNKRIGIIIIAVIGVLAIAYGIAHFMSQSKKGEVIDDMTRDRSDLKPGDISAFNTRMDTLEKEQKTTIQRIADINTKRFEIFEKNRLGFRSALEGGGANETRRLGFDCDSWWTWDVFIPDSQGNFISARRLRKEGLEDAVRRADDRFFTIYNDYVTQIYSLPLVRT
jgi:hypothetical protein